MFNIEIVDTTIPQPKVQQPNMAQSTVELPTITQSNDELVTHLTAQIAALQSPLAQKKNNEKDKNQDEKVLHNVYKLSFENCLIFFI